MSLHDEIEKIDKELGIAAKPEKEAKEDDKVQSESDSGGADDNGDKSAEKASKNASEKSEKADKEDQSADPGKKVEEEEKLSPQDFARLRREAAAAERRAAAAEAKLKEAPQQRQVQETVKPPAGADKEPDPNLDPDAHTRWELSKTKAELRDIAKWKEQTEKVEREKQLKSAAIKAFSDYENNFAPTVKDYQGVTTFGVNQIKSSIRTLNPTLKGEELDEAARRQILRLAAQSESQGHDPAEHFYHQCKAWGYQEPKAVETEKTEEVPKQTVKKMAEHKKKTAGSLSHGGKSGNAPLSREAMQGMKFSDFAKLTPQDLKELESMEA